MTNKVFVKNINGIEFLVVPVQVNDIYEVYGYGNYTINTIFYMTERTSMFYAYPNNSFIIGKLSDEMFELIAQYVSPHKKIKSKTYANLGADIEFEVGETINYKPVFAGNLIEYRSVRSLLRRKVGLDGSQNVIEIRPSAGTEHELFKSTQKLIRKALKKFKVLYTAGDVYPCGTHIHFSIPKYVKKFYDTELYMFKIIKGMDAIAKEILSYGGARGIYRNLSNTRHKPYGFEYRSLPSIIMTTPEIYQKVLNYIALVVKETIFTDVFDIPIHPYEKEEKQHLQEEIIQDIKNLTLEPYYSIAYWWDENTANEYTKKYEGTVQFSKTYEVFEISQHFKNVKSPINIYFGILDTSYPKVYVSSYYIKTLIEKYMPIKFEEITLSPSTVSAPISIRFPFITVKSSSHKVKEFIAKLLEILNYETEKIKFKNKISPLFV